MGGFGVFTSLTNGTALLVAGYGILIYDHILTVGTEVRSLLDKCDVG